MQDCVNLVYTDYFYVKTFQYDSKMIISYQLVNLWIFKNKTKQCWKSYQSKVITANGLVMWRSDRPGKPTYITLTVSFWGLKKTQCRNSSQPRRIHIKWLHVSSMIVKFIKPASVQSSPDVGLLVSMFVKISEKKQIFIKEWWRFTLSMCFLLFMKCYIQSIESHFSLKIWLSHDGILKLIPYLSFNYIYLICCILASGMESSLQMILRIDLVALISNWAPKCRTAYHKMALPEYKEYFRAGTVIFFSWNITTPVSK